MRTFHPKVLTVLLFVLCALLPATVMAQATSAAIRGTITDASGAVVANVAVTAVNDETGIKHSTQSNAEGIYGFPVLTPGAYTISAEVTGFKKAVRKGVEIQLNQVARIDLTLQVGAFAESVIVEEKAPLVDSETASLGRVVASRDVVELPLNKRNFSQLATLMPGSNFGSIDNIGGGSRPDDPRPRSGIFVNGTRESSSTYLVDGVDNYDRIHTTVGIKPSVDAIREFKVQTSLYSAEFGRNAGGVVSVSVKSGTNAFHGSLYEFLRNQVLDARHFFSPSTQPKPHYVLNQFGGTLGGPIKRDRTFFFASYEINRERRAQTTVSSVPTAAMRRGDFTGQAPIFDPTTRLQFLNNQIPASRIDGPAAKLMALYPEPNLPGVANNFVYSPVREQNIDQIDSRVDHSFGEKSNLFVRYSFGDVDTITPAPLPGKAQGGAGFTFAGPNKHRTQGVALGYNYIVTPALVNELRLGYTRIRLGAVPFFFGEKISQEMGITGANLDNVSSGLTSINITGFRGLGNSSFLPIIKYLNTYQITDNIHWTHGKHVVKIGVHFLKPQTNHFQSGNPMGRYAFTAGFTQNPASPTGTGHAMASFLLGFPSNTQRTAQLGPNYHRYLEHATYVQDDWKITPRLTVNLGLRYELITPVTSKRDHLSNFDFATGKIVLAGKDVSRTAGIKTDRNNFAPRLGFAFSWNPKTVLRGGYGVFFDTVPMFAQLRPFPYLINYTRAPSTFVPENRMSDGFPATDFDIAKNAANPFGTIDAVPYDNPLAYIQQANLNVQRTLFGDMALTVAYVGTFGRKLRWVYDENIVRVPGPGTVQTRKPYYGVVPNVVGITTNHPEASSTYHSLQVTGEKRFAQGLSFLTSYTWSHWIDNGVSEAGYGAGGPNPLNILNRRLDRGSSNADIRHRLVYSWIYELPFGENKRWCNTKGPVTWIFGGWQINGIATLQSGLPFTVGESASLLNTGGGNRADRLSDGKLDDRNIGRWFDTTAFGPPAQYAFGTGGRNILYGPGTVNFDFSLFKNIRFRESMNLQFRSEFFNLFNTPSFGLPAATRGAGGFGQISSLVGDMRQIQFSLKFLF